MSIHFSKKWFVAFLLCLLCETGIALFLHDPFIRPFIGDVLVIWLMVFFFRSFLTVQKPHRLIVGVFVFACLIEMAQYFHLLELMNLQGNNLLRVVLGATFDWLDILAYTVGAGLIWLTSPKKQV